MLKVENVRAGYGAVTVLFDISIEVADYEFVCVLGPNGAGKTSLLRAIMGGNRLSAGSVTFDGTALHTLPEDRRAGLGIGYVPEGRHVWPSLTVEENLRLGAWARRRDRGLVGEQMDRVLELFPRLQERFRSRGGVLSGGEQQMVAIGRALMSSPRLILIDEPSIGLAPVAYEAVFEALSRLQKESAVAVLLVEQKVQEALSLCERAYILTGGSIQTSGSTDEISAGEAIEMAYFG
ncbi:MAG: ABC transporter ATP-binding protein [Solirubrobacterales bacterium]